MTGDITVDIGSALPYAIDRVLSIFGRDALTNNARERLEERVRTSVQECLQVQSVGMSKPVPIQNIYQPTRLRLQQYDTGTRLCSTPEIVEAEEDAIVWGPPGSGKTIFLKNAYLTLSQSKSFTPILFILRHANSLDDFQHLVGDLKNKRLFQPGSRKIVLLIDGYDEIPVDARRKVSALLREFSSLQSGFFIATCRSHYELIDTSGRYFWIEPFSQSEATSYCNALIKANGYKIDANQLLIELKQNGFEDFIHSPLMLTLVCILKSGPLPRLPKSTIGLIRRALETLTFRWDESKGIAREGEYILDGEERARCLMRIAAAFLAPTGPESIALAETRIHLQLIQRPDITAERFLLELAQWYGLFVPNRNSLWTFAHRTIHDYLAARHLVETGRFHQKVGLVDSDWTPRSAYAACMSPDATHFMCKALEKSRDLAVFNECLNNSAAFDTKRVAASLISRLSSLSFADSIHLDNRDGNYSVACSDNIFESASTVFLATLFEMAGAAPGNLGADIVYTLSLFEIRRRRLSDLGRYRGRQSGRTLSVKIGAFPEEAFEDQY